MKVLVVLAFFAMLACSAWAAPSGLLGTTIISGPVLAAAPIGTASLVAGPSGLIASKQINPLGVASVGIAPLGLAGLGW